MSSATYSEKEMREAKARQEGLKKFYICQEKEDNEAIKCMYRENVDNNAVTEYYNAWSSSYDRDLDILGYTAPAIAAEQFAKHAQQLGLGKDARILDIGAGTGKAGYELHARGFWNLEANDTNAKMLDVARAKGIYKQYYVGRCQDLSLTEKSFDAILIVGTNFLGFLGTISTFVKPGGLLLTAQNANSRAHYQDHLDEMEKAGVWQCLEDVVYPQKWFIGEDALILAYKIL